MYELLCEIDLVDAEDLRVDKELKALCSLNLKQILTSSRQRLMS